MSHLRRLSALLLSLAVLLSAVSCGGAYPELREYSAALDGAAPSSAKVESSMDTELGLLTAEYDARWLDGAITVDYTKDKLSELAPDSTPDGILAEETGTATVAADGTVTGSIGGLVLSLLTRAIELDGEKITYTEEEDTLTFTVSGENTEAVLGVGVDADVTVKITLLSQERVKSISLSYTAAGGDASVACEFEY